MVNRPVHMNAYEFVVLAALRAQQLLPGVSHESKATIAPPRWRRWKWLAVSFPRGRGAPRHWSLVELDEVCLSTRALEAMTV